MSNSNYSIYLSTKNDANILAEYIDDNRGNILPHIHTSLSAFLSILRMKTIYYANLIDLEERGVDEPEEARRARKSIEIAEKQLRTDVFTISSIKIPQKNNNIRQ